MYVISTIHIPNQERKRLWSSKRWYKSIELKQMNCKHRLNLRNNCKKYIFFEYEGKKWAKTNAYEYK